MYRKSVVTIYLLFDIHESTSEKAPEPLEGWNGGYRGNSAYFRTWKGDEREVTDWVSGGIKGNTGGNSVVGLLRELCRLQFESCLM